MNSRIAAIIVVAWLAIAPTLRAEIVLSVEPGLVFAAGSGIREINLLARSTSPATDRLLALAADLKVTDAVFSFVPTNEFIADNYDPDPLSPTFRQWFSSGPRYTRLFNESDYIGFGNINKDGGSSLVSDSILVGSVFVPDPTTARLSLEFDNAQLFPETDARLGKLRVDITNLAPGQYPIDFTFIFADGTMMNEIPSRSSNGFFTIAAIPEPTSIALLGGTLLITSIHRSARSKTWFSRRSLGNRR
jgi:hypothetical protein